MHALNQSALFCRVNDVLFWVSLILPLDIELVLTIVGRLSLNLWWPDTNFPDTTHMAPESAMETQKRVITAWKHHCSPQRFSKTMARSKITTRDNALFRGTNNFQFASNVGSGD